MPKGSVTSFRHVLFAALVLASSAAFSRDEGTLRVATFNTYLLSNKFRCINFRDEPGKVIDREIDITGKIDCLTKNTFLPGMPTPDEIVDQADQIANSILSLGDSVDVIVLNEVWDEGAKDRLVERLSPIFPNFISRIDPGIELPGEDSLGFLGIPEPAIPNFSAEDSGLMYFARSNVRFLPMKGSPTPFPPGGLSGTTTQVRAESFIEAGGFDALAAKSVAAVHIEHSFGGMRARAYLLFTHLQADADKQDERRGQLRQINKFIQYHVIDPSLPAEEEYSRVMILGDLNIEGRNAVLPVPAGKQFDPEWHAHFTSGFPGLRIGDAWARDNSEKYIGPTFLRDTIANSERLDYVLVPPASDDVGYCVQYERVMLEDSRSDHSALVADLNKQFPFCSPRTAARPPMTGDFNPAVGKNFDATRIKFPGAIQWFRFEETSAATVDVVVSPGEVKPLMFPATDLSRPISPVESNERVTTWSVPGDFFIQTSGKTRQTTGDYSIGFTRRNCSMAEAPCYLTPTLAQDATFPANDLLGPEDAAWFRMDVTEAPDSGGPQSIVAFVRMPKGYIVTVHDADNPALEIKADIFSISGRGTVVTLEVTGTKKYLLKIARDNDKSVPAQVSAQWTNNLTIVDVRVLICFDETDGFLGSEAGEDEIALVLQYDGITRRTPSSGFTDFDCNADKDEDDSFKQLIRTIGPVSAYIIEDDDSLDDNASAVLTIAPMAPAKGMRMGAEILDAGLQTIKWNPFEEGDYGLKYYLRTGSSGLPLK
jgi:hypothetical protein